MERNCLKDGKEVFKDGKEVFKRWKGSV